jgi:amino acid transporter
MIGSGWLFGAYYAAQTAGPLALASWPIAGAAMMLVGLVLVQLGATRPRAGGMVRWPLEANGPLVGTAIGWAVLLAAASALAAEATAIVQYTERYVPGLIHAGRLTVGGTAVAVGLLAALVLLNWFGVRLFARANAVFTVVKLAVPLLTIAALLASGLDTDNVGTGGGIAPYGWSAALTAVSSAGVIYTFNGFAAPVELSAEARDPRRDLPRAVITAIVLGTLLYMTLQLVFLLSVPGDRLGQGWQGLSFDSPFGQLALALNLGWLATVIYADAVFSPVGAANVFVATSSRETYAAARNGVLPAFFTAVHTKAGVPRRALLANFALSCLFLAPFRGWQEIIGVVGVLSLLTYSACAVAVGSFRARDIAGRVRWMRGMAVIAPAGFVVSTELLHWAGWTYLRTAVPLLAVSVLLFAGQWRRAGHRPWAELRSGLWFLTYLAILFALSATGSTGGTGAISAPWDAITAAALGLAVYHWGVRSGARRTDDSQHDADAAHEGER